MDLNFLAKLIYFNHISNSCVGGLQIFTKFWYVVGLKNKEKLLQYFAPLGALGPNTNIEKPKIVLI